MKLDRRRIKVIAFDVHDTLVYWPAGGPRKTTFAIQQLLAEHDIHVSYQSIIAARAMIMTFDSATQRFEDAGALLRAVFARLRIELAPDILDAAVETYDRMMAMELFEDSPEVVAALHRAPLRTCTFTTLPWWAVQDALAPLRTELDEYFDNYRAGRPKGHVEFYRSITKQLGVRPDEVLAIGDEAEADVIIPAGLGWQCVHLQRRRRSTPPSEAVAAVGNLREFLALVESG